MSGYDPVAEEYASEYFHELGHKPFDRELLDEFVRRASPLGPLADLGCGPGQVARYLADQGAEAIGVDLSPRTVEKARALSPDLRFECGDMRALPFANGSLGGIAAFYSLIHIPREGLAGVLGELRRALAPGGFVLVAFHVGDEVKHLDEWWGHPVDLDFHFFEMPWVVEALETAGFRVEQTWRRDPYPEGEVDTQRGYVLASR